MTIGKRIRAARIKAGFSQDWLGYVIGKTEVTVCAWENGRSVPRIGDLPKLSRVLHRSIDYLITGREYRAARPARRRRSV